MIKTSELRRGNRIKVAGTPFDEVVEVTAIDEDTIDTTAYFDGQMGCCGCTDEMAEPVPLTEQWLERMGFVKTILGSEASHGLMIPYTPICIQVWKYGSKYIARLMMFPDHKLSQPLTCVHQLQNLYFALIGEELTIKETV